MTELTQDLIDGLAVAEADMGNPVFTFAGTDYGCVPSVNEFRRTLDMGGFATDKMLTLCARLLDSSGNDIFTTLPVAQNLVTYNGENFRVESTKKHPTGAYLRIVAINTTKGV